MKKMGILVVIGIILSVFGIVIMVSAGIYAASDYGKYNKNYEGKVSLEDIDYKFEIDYAKVNIYNTTEESHIDYKINSLYKIVDENGNFKVESKVSIFGFLFGRNNEVNIYLNENVNDNKLEFKLNAGSINSAVDITCSALNVELNAGSITFSNIVCNNIIVKVNAGSLNINNSTVNDFVSELNAGSMNITSTFNNLKFDVNAGSMNLKTVGELSDYTIKIDKSAGSSNVSNGGSGAKKIDGDISAGSFNLSFSN